MFPVVEGGRLAGVREMRGIARERWGEFTVHDIMSAPSLETCVAGETEAAAVLRLMQRSGVTRLAVVEGSRLVGIVTLKDILGRVELKMALEGGA